MQFSIRRMLIFTVAVAVVIFWYMSIRTVVSSQTAAVGFFGPGPLDYSAAHDHLLAEIDRSKYKPIDAPAWAEGGGGYTNHLPVRSNWFLVTNGSASNFIHVTSSNTGFSVDVWVYKVTTNHQTADRENLLKSEAVPYFANWWKKWLKGNRP